MRDNQLLCRILQNYSFIVCQRSWNIHCEWRLMSCRSRSRDVLSTQLQISNFTAEWCSTIATKTRGRNVFHMSTRGLSLFTIQVSVHSQKCCQECTTVWKRTGGSLCQPKKQGTEQNAQQCKKKRTWGKSTKSTCWSLSKKQNRCKVVYQCLPKPLRKLKGLRLN